MEELAAALVLSSGALFPSTVEAMATVEAVASNSTSRCRNVVVAMYFSRWYQRSIQDAVAVVLKQMVDVCTESLYHV
jgi:hypothetical protein